MRRRRPSADELAEMRAEVRAGDGRARADDRRAALMERRLIAEILAGVAGCPLCGRASGDPTGATLCHRCRRQLDPTPLEQVLDAVGWTIGEFAELTGIPERTVRRAARGVRVSRRVAVRLAKITGLEPEAFRPPALDGDDAD